MTSPLSTLGLRACGLAAAALALAVHAPARAGATETSAAAPATAASAAAGLPTHSIYQLAASLTDQNGRTFRMADSRGKPMLVSMFYTSCQYVCPMLIEAMRDTEAKLSAAERDRLSVLMVSFDPAHDTVAVLKHTAEERGLDSRHWTLARTDAATARKIAAVLGVQYRALPNGDFNHTTALILVDAEGRIAGRTSLLGNADPTFVKLVRAAVQPAAN